MTVVSRPQTPPERKRLVAQAKHLRALRCQERDMRNGFHTDTKFPEHLMWRLRALQKGIEKVVRRYSQKKKALTSPKARIPCALPPGVPGDLP